MRKLITKPRLCCVQSVILLCVTPLLAQTSGQIEPRAGNWKTWVISSGKDYRVPPPPGETATRGELEWLRGVIAEKDPQIASQVAFWDAGAPSYRWLDLITNRVLSGAPVSAYAHRVYTYVALAMYDATVATWDSKYAYNRPRPGALDPTLQTRLPTPRSPSYPSEYAATAGAAAGVLAYFFPNEAQSFQGLAEEAGKSRLYAGLEYPTDYFAGLELGRKVAEAVVARAKADGSDAVWTGTVPTGKCNWVGVNPGNVTGPTWKPFLLSAANEFRPPTPPACDSAEMVPQIAEVRNFPRSPAAFTTNSRALYWQSPEGINFWPYVYVNKWLFEDKLDQNPPRAARAYALIAAAFFDAFIASQDGKFTYWYIRPHQLDPAIVPIMPVPNFPSYPSNHSTYSATRSEIVAYLFPKHADEIRALGKEAGDSRIWAGIHYTIDNESGVRLGRSVAQKFIAWAEADGSK
jgi:membrane-associated phospholipid phosphatase